MRPPADVVLEAGFDNGRALASSTPGRAWESMVHDELADRLADRDCWRRLHRAGHDGSPDPLIDPIIPSRAEQDKMTLGLSMPNASSCT